MKCVNTGKYKAVEYSVIGQNHVETGQENQDSILTEFFGDEAGFMVLADGVSSASNSKKGSLIATKVIRELCLEFIEFGIKDRDLDSIKVEVVRKWKEQVGSDWNNCATTINFLIFVGNILLIGQIGDGLMVVDIDGETIISTDNTEFYSSETDALGEQVRRSSFKLTKKEFENSFHAYMVTDGIGKEVAIESRIPLGAYLNKILDKDADTIQYELEEWIDGLGQKNGDDKTIGFIKMEES